jgi:hypothetical protein
LSKATVSLENLVAGSRTNVSVSLSPSSDVSGRISLVLPPTITVNTSGSIPVRSVQVDSRTLCSQSTSACPVSNVSSRPQYAVEIHAVTPVSGFFDEILVVTIFGANFIANSNSFARFGSLLVRTTVISDSEMRASIDCTTLNTNSPPVCKFQEPLGKVVVQGCNMSTSAVGVLFPSKCSEKLCIASQNQSSCQNLTTKISIDVEVSPDGNVFTNSKVKYTIYRRLVNDCPNNCGTSKMGMCVDGQCSCTFPYDGIDCGIAPTPLSVTPNFGPISGDTIRFNDEFYRV